MQQVLVVGVPRGGTTWIAEALSQCRAVRYVHEPDGAHDPFAFRARRRDELAHYPVLHPGDAAPEYARLWSGVFEGGAKAGSLRDHLARRVYQRVTPAQKTQAANGERISVSLRVADALAEPRTAGRTDGSTPATVLAKSVNAPLAAGWIYDRFRPSVLVVQRDLRNVLSSWLSLDFKGPGPAMFARVTAEAERRWGITPAVPDDAFARAAAMLTVMTVALHDDARANGWAVLEHEAACVDPAVRIRAAADATGLEWTESASAFVVESDQPGSGYATRRVARNLPEAWKKKLSAEHLELIDLATTSFPADLRAVAIPS